MPHGVLPTHMERSGVGQNTSASFGSMNAAARRDRREAGAHGSGVGKIQSQSPGREQKASSVERMFDLEAQGSDCDHKHRTRAQNPAEVVVCQMSPSKKCATIAFDPVLLRTTSH